MMYLQHQFIFHALTVVDAIFNSKKVWILSRNKMKIIVINCGLSKQLSGNEEFRICMIINTIINVIIIITINNKKGEQKF